MSAASAKNNQETQTRNIPIADLQKILLKEVHSPTLTSFDLDLYKRVAATINMLKSDGYEGIQAKARDRIVELISISITSLLEIRHQKIVTAVIASGNDGNGTAIDYSKLTDEEKYILHGASDYQKRTEAVICACRDGRPKVLESLAEKVRSKRIVVRFLKPSGQFIGIDLLTYGPFKEEDVATIPFENARPFIASGTAIEVQASLI